MIIINRLIMPKNSAELIISSENELHILCIPSPCYDDIINNQLTLYLRSIQNLYISGANPMYIKNCNKFFADCTSLESISNVTFTKLFSVESVFSNCISLKTVSNLTIINVGNIDLLFYGCSSLMEIDGFTMSSVNGSTSKHRIDSSKEQKPYNPFGLCKSLKTLKNIAITHCPNMSKMFCNCDSLESITALKIRNVKVVNNMFEKCSSLQFIHHVVISKVGCASNMFHECTSLTDVKYIRLATAGVKSMFSHCTSLVNVTGLYENNSDLRNAFDGCVSLRTITNLYLSGGIVSELFKNCSSILTITAIYMINMGTPCAFQYRIDLQSMNDDYSTNLIEPFGIFKAIATEVHINFMHISVTDPNCIFINRHYLFSEYSSSPDCIKIGNLKITYGNTVVIYSNNIYAMSLYKIWSALSSMNLKINISSVIDNVYLRFQYRIPKYSSEFMQQMEDVERNRLYYGF